MNWQKALLPAWTKTAHSRISPEVGFILILIGLSRLVLTVVGFISRHLMEPYHGEAYVWVYSNKVWLDIWGVWDTGWYLRIAAHGYPVLDDPALLSGGQTVYPFFPLYPMMMNLFSHLTGDLFTAGLLVSNVSLFFACLFLFHLVEKDRGSQHARHSVFFLIVFPTSFILSGVFTESLYLMLVLGCFLAAREGRWGLVGILAVPVVLVRNLGVLLVIPMAWIYMRHIDFDWRRIRADLLTLFAFPATLVGFSIYVFLKTGDLLAFVHAQAAWGRAATRINPLWQLWGGLTQGEPHVQFRVVFVLMSITVLCLGFRKIGFPAWFFGIYTVMVPCASSLLSLERYVSVLFPLAIIIGSMKMGLLRDLVVITLAVLQGFMMVFWANGFPFVI